MDSLFFPKYRITLLRILNEEISRAKLKVEEITVPQEGNYTTSVVQVGPYVQEMLGDRPYDGWVPQNVLDKLRS